MKTTTSQEDAHPQYGPSHKDVWAQCQRVACVLGLDPATVAQIAAGLKVADHTTRAVVSEEQMGAMVQLAECLVERFVSPFARRRWLGSPAQELGHRSPLALVVSGETTRVIAFCHTDKITSDARSEHILRSLERVVETTAQERPFRGRGRGDARQELRA